MAANPNARHPELHDDEASYPDMERQSMRVSRWTSLLYLVVALATPLIVYSGPDVLSPSAPAIANAAIDGRLAIHRQHSCADPHANATGPRAPTRKTC